MLAVSCLAGPNADAAVDAASDSVMAADVSFGGSIIACQARILRTDERPNHLQINIRLDPGQNQSQLCCQFGCQTNRNMKMRWQLKRVA